MTHHRDPLLIVTPHSSGQVPADILREMLGDDMFDTPKREAFLRRVFMDGDAYTDLIYAASGTRLIAAPWSRFAVDLNRVRDDRVDNGVIKMMTFDREPLYPPEFALSEGAREARLRRIWDSFDAQISAELPEASLLIVGHCMAPHGPKLGLDTGTPRPAICLMLGTEADPTFPLAHWAALKAACESAFAEVIAASPYQDVKIGVPWETDTLSATYHTRSGIPAFGIELNSGLYLQDEQPKKNPPKDDAIRALAGAFETFADAALAIVGN